MQPGDKKRLEREANIAKAVRGPDYSVMESDIARVKAAAAKRSEAARDSEKQRQHGRKMMSWYYEALEHGPVNPSAPSQVKGRDHGQEQ